MKNVIVYALWGDNPLYWENNYGLQKETEFLLSKGYKQHSNIQWDSVFVKITNS